MKPGDKVRKIANPSRVGVLTDETSGSSSRLRYLVIFPDGEEFVLAESLEVVAGKKSQDPFDLISQGRFGRVPDLRGSITFYRLSGKLANLIYSLNTTNTQFLPYQFKPVMQFLDSPSNGLLIADEVGLGKTIEAGLIWTELRARQDARRLLIVCPAMLRDKWKMELSNRFGVAAQIVDAANLLEHLEEVRRNPQASFALIASMQGVRPSSRWDVDDEPSMSSAAKLARFLKETELDDPLLDLVVIDEAHYLRNQTTKTHLFGTLVRPVALNMVMLSATPIQLNSTDLYNLLHLLDEDAFPYEGSFDMVLRMNEPVVRLRDRILSGQVDRDEFVQTIEAISQLPYYQESQQVQHFLKAPPSADELGSARVRADLGDLLDRLNPLSKVVSRTLKREVMEGRVQREAVVIRAKMSEVESAFYTAVTEKIRHFCAFMDVSEGFMLTIPQRQISSSMAAACQGWLGRTADIEPDDEQLYELDAVPDTDSEFKRNKSKPVKSMGDLLTELVRIARQVGNVSALKQHDSKYSELIANLRRYWKANPGKKVVLFAFYKNTLHYLAERLQADGIASVVVHGGMDKQEALKAFENPVGPDILLSSEVASEGVDLQFSSLLVNYDLPWNPAKIEQRIGRIDRIGQELNHTTYNLARMNMFLHNVNYDKFNIQLGDTLIEPHFGDDKPFDAIVSNPPYSVKWVGSDDPTLINDDRFAPAGVLAPRSKADFAFVLHALSYLSSKGRAAIVCFPGIFYRGGAEQRIRQYLVENNYVETVISLAPNLFYGTTIAVTILVLAKNKKDTTTQFIDASGLFKKETNNNVLLDEHIKEIMAVFESKANVDHFAQSVPFEKVAANDYNLSVSSYVEAKDTREVVDIAQLNAQLKITVAKIDQLRKDIDAIVAEIEGEEQQAWPHR